MNFIISDTGRISAVVGGKPFVVSPDHPNYKGILRALNQNDEMMFEAAVDIPNAIMNYSAQNVRIADGKFFLRDSDQEIHNALTERILAMMQGGYPFQPMVAFLSNLLENPSARAVNELYSFLENRDLPITEDGFFLAYKRVRADFTDVHTGRINNSIGSTPSMPRNLVDDDYGKECSQGLHVGSIRYVSNFAASPENPVVIVKINPRDVVSVPVAEDATKCRVCRYEVIDLFRGVLDLPVYSSDGGDFDLGEDPDESDFQDDDDLGEGEMDMRDEDTWPDGKREPAYGVHVVTPVAR
jgi:hypothetical protein